MQTNNEVLNVDSLLYCSLAVPQSRYLTGRNMMRGSPTPERHLDPTHQVSLPLGQIWILNLVKTKMGPRGSPTYNKNVEKQQKQNKQKDHTRKHTRDPSWF